LRLTGAAFTQPSERRFPSKPGANRHAKGNTLYLHAFDWPRDGKLVVGGLQSAIATAYLLADPKRKQLKWKNPQDWVGWKVRVNEAAEFEISAKYTTGSSGNRGSYTVTIGDQVLKATVEPTPSENQSTTVSLGRIKLAPGQYELAVKPVEIKGGELMRLFHVALTPVGGS